MLGAINNDSKECDKNNNNQWIALTGVKKCFPG